jgi:hypothetical protein
VSALAIIGCTVGGAVLGGIVGAIRADREGPDDLGFGLLIFGGEGVIVGGFIGCVVGAVLFAS